MALLACCLYLLLIALVGYTVLSAIHPPGRLTIVQLTGFCPAIGAGTVGLLLFWMSLMGYAPVANGAGHHRSTGGGRLGCIEKTRAGCCEFTWWRMIWMKATVGSSCRWQ